MAMRPCVIPIYGHTTRPFFGASGATSLVRVFKLAPVVSDGCQMGIACSSSPVECQMGVRWVSDEYRMFKLAKYTCFSYACTPHVHALWAVMPHCNGMPLEQGLRCYGKSMRYAHIWSSDTRCNGMPLELGLRCYGKRFRRP